MSSNYAAHVAERRRTTEAALAAEGFDALVISSGTPFTYYSDDQDAPFKRTPHFAHWVPLAGPEHLLHVASAKRPKLVRVAPEDYWYEQAPLGDPFWKREYDFVEVGDAAKAWKELSLTPRTAYVGDQPDAAKAAGFAPNAINPPKLVARLDWERAYKSAYEVECLSKATERAAKGHQAARAAFERGASELEIHQLYLEQTGCLERELPYESIVALDEKGATLHYQSKRAKKDGRVLLIDVGAPHAGYGSDITRTWTTAAADATFRDLQCGVDALEQRLCAMVKPGIPYLDIHVAAHREIANLLAQLGVFKVSGAEAFERGLTRPFFPHGVGHFLGIQVHDVGGRQAEPSGGTKAPPAAYPYLRTTRQVEDRQVFTIEPGVYFIPMLLREHRTGANAAAFDWALIDRLTPCGGVRIEDNVHVTPSGHQNLTRPHV
ncbi:MAG: Xaa-Pro dipeptidase [Planctomycetes bacterium]|nr:Xaa-Pro dipeptidase [Planctomycetota bacterium]